MVLAVAPATAATPPLVFLLAPQLVVPEAAPLMARLAPQSVDLPPANAKHAQQGLCSAKRIAPAHAQHALWHVQHQACSVMAQCVVGRRRHGGGGPRRLAEVAASAVVEFSFRTPPSTGAAAQPRKVSSGPLCQGARSGRSAPFSRSAVGRTRRAGSCAQRPGTGGCSAPGRMVNDSCSVAGGTVNGGGNIIPSSSGSASLSSSVAAGAAHPGGRTNRGTNGGDGDVGGSNSVAYGIW